MTDQEQRIAELEQLLSEAMVKIGKLQDEAFEAAKSKNDLTKQLSLTPADLLARVKRVERMEKALNEISKSVRHTPSSMSTKFSPTNEAIIAQEALALIEEKEQ